MMLLTFIVGLVFGFIVGGITCVRWFDRHTRGL